MSSLCLVIMASLSQQAASFTMDGKAPISGYTIDFGDVRVMHWDTYGFRKRYNLG